MTHTEQPCGWTPDRWTKTSAAWPALREHLKTHPQSKVELLTDIITGTTGVGKQAAHNFIRELNHHGYLRRDRKGAYSLRTETTTSPTQTSDTTEAGPHHPQPQPPTQPQGEHPMTDTTTDRHAVDYGRPGTHLAALAATIADMATAVEEARDVMRRAVAERNVMQSAIHELVAAHSVKHIPGIPGYENLTGFSRCECGGYELPCPARAGLERILDPDGKAVERVLADLYRPAASTFEEAFSRWRADGAPDVPPEVDTALAMFETGDAPWLRPREAREDRLPELYAAAAAQPVNPDQEEQS